MRRWAVGDAAFFGGLLGGAGEEAAEGFAGERVALDGRKDVLIHGVVQDFLQDAVGGHEGDDLAHDAGRAGHGDGDDDFVLVVEEVVGGRDPDAEEVDQLAVQQTARGGDVHQVVDGLEESGKKVSAPAEVGFGQRCGADLIGGGGVGGGKQERGEAGMHRADAFLLFAQGGAGDAAGFE